MNNILLSESFESLDSQSTSFSSKRNSTVSDQSSIEILNNLEEKPCNDEERSELSVEFDFAKSCLVSTTSDTHTEDDGILQLY